MSYVEREPWTPPSPKRAERIAARVAGGLIGAAVVILAGANWMLRTVRKW